MPQITWTNITAGRLPIRRGDIAETTDHFVIHHDYEKGWVWFFYQQDQLIAQGAEICGLDAMNAAQKYLDSK